MSNTRSPLRIPTEDPEATGSRQRWLGGVALALVLIACAVTGARWLTDPAQFPLRKVEVDGDDLQHLDRAALAAALEPLLQAGFFGSSVAAIQSAVKQQPWVERASVRRLWPDRLNVQLVEQQAVALWAQSSLLSEQGEVFTPATIPATFQSLPRLTGPVGHEQQVLESYRNMSEMLKGLGLAIHELEQNARRSWHMQLSNGMEIQLGRAHPVSRLARFIRAYPAILASANARVAAVDLRYSNGFAVRWLAATAADRKG